MAAAVRGRGRRGEQGDSDRRREGSGFHQEEEGDRGERHGI